VSVTLPLQLRIYELLACKRMSAEARLAAKRRFVAARSDGGVRVLIRELEQLPDMKAEETAWDDIEHDMDGILPFLGEAP
jgi:hypothetical protein